MTYRVATGSNVALVNLTVLDPQPSSTGIRATRRTYSADGSALDEGRYVELEFDFVESASAYASLLALFGVQNDLTADVTVYVRDETYTAVRMNGIACRPEVGRDITWDRFFPRNLKMLIKNLEVST